MNIKNNKELLNILVLMLFCVIIFFAFLNTYPFLDFGETKYVRIAQEMLNSHNFFTPTINGEMFFEKPPLFFWFENISFLIFGVSEYSARVPMALTASFGVFMTYFCGRWFVNSKFGLLSAMAVGTSVIYIVFSHIANLDLLLSVTMMTSVYLGIMTLFSQGKTNNFQWFGFCIFSALSVLTKGFSGIIIPFAVVILAYAFSKRLKELFDYKRITISIFVLLLIILPWHIMMCIVHGQTFITEYIIKHNFAEFFSSVGVNQKESFWFYVPVIFAGTIPFAFTLITVLINEIRKIFVNFKTGFNFSIYKYFSPDNIIEKRFLSLNILAFLTIFLFFSISSTKLPSNILPVVFPLSFITGYIFYEYTEYNKFDTQIKISNIAVSIISYLFGIGSILVISLYNISFDFNFEMTSDLKNFLFFTGILLLFYSFYNFINFGKISSNEKFFNSSVILMIVLTLITNIIIFNLIVNNGQNELIKYAKYAKSTDKKLATFDFGHRYSVIVYYGNHVEINEKPDYKWMEEKLNEDYFIILKNKNMIKMPAEYKFDVIDSGKKYSLIKKLED